MSLAFHVTPASSLIFSGFYNGRRSYPITGFQENFGFVYKNNFLQPSGLRFETHQKSRLLKSVQSLAYIYCEWRIGFSSVAASYSAASSFNYTVSDFEVCERMEGLELREAANDDGSHTNTGYGNGNGGSRGDSRGGGDNGGTGSGGLGESDDWEGLRWFCWQIFKAWKYYNNLANLSSIVVAGVGNIQVKIEGCLKEILEPNFDGLKELLREILGLLLLPFVLIAVAFCATLFAGILLFCCVVAVLIWFWRSPQPSQHTRRSQRPSEIRGKKLKY